MAQAKKHEYPQIGQAQALAPFVVRVAWKNGVRDDVDLAGHFQAHAKAFGPLLEDPERFAGMELEEWGWSVTWGGDMQVGSDLLWRLHQYAQGNSLSPAAFCAWMERHGLTLERAAGLLGLTSRTIANYRSGVYPVPRAVVLATTAVDMQARGGLGRARQWEDLLERCVRSATEAAMAEVRRRLPELVAGAEAQAGEAGQRDPLYPPR